MNSTMFNHAQIEQTVIQEAALETVNEYVYQGQLLHTISSLELEIQRWICGRAGVLLENKVTYWGALYCFDGDGLGHNWYNRW